MATIKHGDRTSRRSGWTATPLPRFQMRKKSEAHSGAQLFAPPALSENGDHQARCPRLSALRMDVESDAIIEK
jgi:hypothetical protein